MSKLTDVIGLRAAVQRLAALLAGAAQAAALDIDTLNREKVSRSDYNAGMEAMGAALANRLTKPEVDALIEAAIAAHDASKDSHPTHIAIR